MLLEPITAAGQDASDHTQHKQSIKPKVSFRFQRLLEENRDLYLMFTKVLHEKQQDGFQHFPREDLHKT